MRILQIGKYLSPVPGGMETVVDELCRGLAKQGVDVHCLVSNTMPKTVVEDRSGFHVTRVARFGTLASTPLSPGFGLHARRIHADLAHFHLPNPLATFVFSEPSMPYVVTYHCDIARYKKLLMAYRPHLEKFLRGSRKIIVSSKNLISSSPLLIVFRDKCRVIPFGIDTDHFQATSENQTLSLSLKGKYGEKIVLFVGRLVKYKGLQHLIPAMGGVDGHLLIVGDGPERSALESLSRKKDLTSKVHFLGHVPQEDLAAYYQASQAVALTSINESEAFGMTLLDGLAFGKPLLTTDLSTGVADVNLDGVTGFRVPVGNTDAMTRALRKLLENPALRAEMGENSLKHFRDHFNYEKMIASHLELYREVVGGNS